MENEGDSKTMQTSFKETEFLFKAAEKLFKKTAGRTLAHHKYP